MSDPFIRPFHFQDMEAVTAIYAEAVTNGTGSYETEPPSEKDMRGRFTMLIAQGFPVFVAMLDDEVAGFAYVSHFRPRPAFRWLAEDSIYVAPAAKGKGIGRLLLSALIEQCTALGFRQILAVIGDGEQNAASIGLHKSLGFVECGRIVGSGYKHDRWLDTVMMQLALNGGNVSAPDKPPLP